MEIRNWRKILLLKFAGSKHLPTHLTNFLTNSWSGAHVAKPAVAKLLSQSLVLMAAAVGSLRSYTPRGTCPSLYSFHHVILYVLNTLEYDLSVYAYSWQVVTELQIFQPNSSQSYHFNSFYMPVHLILLHSTIPTMLHEAPHHAPPNTPSPLVPQFVSAPRALSLI